MSVKNIRKVLTRPRRKNLLSWCVSWRGRQIRHSTARRTPDHEEEDWGFDVSQSTLRTESNLSDLASVDVEADKEEQEENGGLEDYKLNRFPLLSDITDIANEHKNTHKRPPANVSRTQQERHKKTVNFKPTTLVYDVLSVHEMTDEEIENAWWSRDDLRKRGDRAKAMCTKCHSCLVEAVNKCRLKARRLASENRSISRAEIKRSKLFAALSRSSDQWIVEGDSCRGLERYMPTTDVSEWSRIPAQRLSDRKTLSRYQKRSRAAGLFAQMLALLDAAHAVQEERRY